MSDSHNCDACAHDRGLDRAIGFVLSELIVSAQTTPADQTAIAQCRRLLSADAEELNSSLATLGCDSLAWMSVLTGLEEKIGVQFSDEEVSDRRAYTPIGLARVVMASVRNRGETESVETPD